MKKSVFLAAMIAFTMFSGSVLAEEICDFKLIPANPSVNGSVIVVVPTYFVASNLSNLTGAMRIEWDIQDPIEHNLVARGLLHRFGDCWVCEFSGKYSNFEGNCGPSPFRYSGNYLFNGYAFNYDKSVYFDWDVPVNSKTMKHAINIVDDDVYISVEAPIDTEYVSIKIYDAYTGKIVDDVEKKNLTKGNSSGVFFTSIESVDPGTYYLAFSFKTSDKYRGGDLAKFTIGTEGVELNTKIDKSSYWLGESVMISGQTKYSTVTLKLQKPSGAFEEIDKVTAVSERYSAEYVLPIGYAEGDYRIVAEAGNATADVTFNAKRLFSVSKTAASFTVSNRSVRSSENITIQNTGVETLTLSVTTQGLGTAAEARIDKSVVAASSSTVLTIETNPLTVFDDVEGKVIVTGNGIVAVPIDVSINLDLPGQATGAGTAMDISPGYLFTDDCRMDEEYEASFTVKNTGSTLMNAFSYNPSGISLSEGTSAPSSISAGGIGTLKLVLVPDSRVNEGYVTLTSSGGSSNIYIKMMCTGDISYDIETLSTDIAILKETFAGLGFDSATVDDMFYIIDSEVSDTQSSYDSGEYATAAESYASAKARYEAFQEIALAMELGGPSPGGDSSWVTYVIIVIVLAVLGGAGFFVYSKYGSKLKGGSEDSPQGEESYDEELY
ncbi:MAG: hypothetical protein JW789_01435 [Candidatus Aenigmarchaeota archaeon]|nr:hypothetical protein [Candidatus Aenigmarchaeota archaeon]